MRLFDSSVIIDARDADSPFHAWAKQRIAEAVAGDGAAANTVVVSEVSVRARNRDAVPGLLEQGSTVDWNSSWAHGSRALAVLRWSWL